MREAISKLQAAGIVTMGHGIGTFVLDNSDKAAFGNNGGLITAIGDVLAMLELQIGTEVEAATLGAIRHTKARLHEMRGARYSFRDHLARGKPAVDPDFQFHFGIARAAENDYFSNILNYLGSSIIPCAVSIQRQPYLGEYLVRISREHEDPYGDVARSDPEAAIQNHFGQ